MTNDLERRLVEHKQKLTDGFTAKYNVNRLVFYEEFMNVTEAIETEKKIKGWSRAKKIALIESKNPDWRDLSDDRHSEGAYATELSVSKTAWLTGFFGRLGSL